MRIIASLKAMLTPDEIESASLRRRLFGGYRVRNTQELLRQISWDLRGVLHERTTLEEENRSLRAELERRDHKDEIEDATLRSAQQAAGQILEEARRDAELILEKAYKQASEIRATAEQEASSRVAKLDALEEKSTSMYTELRGLITSLLEAPTGGRRAGARGRRPG